VELEARCGVVNFGAFDFCDGVGEPFVLFCDVDFAGVI
jgi:hypothetical protein